MSSNNSHNITIDPATGGSELQWSDWTPEVVTTDEIPADTPVSPGIVDPAEYDPTDAEDLPLPIGSMPDTRDLLQTLENVEMAEEALKSAKTIKPGDDLPDLPHETLSVTSDVYKIQEDVSALTRQVAVIPGMTSRLGALEDQLKALVLKVDGIVDTITVQSADQHRLRTELSGLSTSIASSISASERKIMNALTRVTPSVILPEVTEQAIPSEVTLPGPGGHIEATSSQPSEPTTAKPKSEKKKVVIPGW